MQRYTAYRTDLRRREEEERTAIMGEALNSNGPQTKCTRYIEARQPDRPWSNDRKMLRSFYEILASIDYRRKRACVLVLYFIETTSHLRNDRISRSEKKVSSKSWHLLRFPTSSVSFITRTTFETLRTLIVSVSLFLPQIHLG